MLGRIGGAAIALGLIVTLPDAIAQEPTEPALESQPEAGRRQQDGGPTSQQDAAPTHESAPELLPALQGIETAIRDLISEEDEIARQRQEERQRSDLKAQEKMARWTFWMFAAALATVVVTAAGVYLIWRTLQYTRAAAIYTKTAAEAAVDSVEKAKQSTAAAREAASAATSQLTISSRGYLFPQSVGITKAVLNYKDGAPSAGVFLFSVLVKNVGVAPGTVTRIIYLSKLVEWHIDPSEIDWSFNAPTLTGKQHLVRAASSIYLISNSRLTTRRAFTLENFGFSSWYESNTVACIGQRNFSTLSRDSKPSLGKIRFGFSTK